MRTGRRALCASTSGRGPEFDGSTRSRATSTRSWSTAHAGVMVKVVAPTGPAAHGFGPLSVYRPLVPSRSKVYGALAGAASTNTADGGGHHRADSRALHASSIRFCTRNTRSTRRERQGPPSDSALTLHARFGHKPSLTMPPRRLQWFDCRTMGSLGPAAALWLLVVVAMVAAACGFAASIVTRRNHRRTRRIFMLGFLCGYAANPLVRRRRRGSHHIAARALAVVRSF